MDPTGPTLISFCTGYGGLELGIERALGRPCRVLAFSEIEAFAIENLAAKVQAGLLPPAPIWSDLRTFPGEAFYGMVDILCGGYPCQPWSTAGKRRGKHDPRHLWPYFRQQIRAMHPRLVFFENVEGHISLGLPTVLSDLEEDGYKATWGIFAAEEVGAPHRRKRVFILGYARGDNERGRPFATVCREGVAAGGSGGDAVADANSLQQAAFGRVYGDLAGVRHSLPQREACTGCAGEPGADVGDPHDPQTARQRRDGGEVLPLAESEGSVLCGNDVADSGGEGLQNTVCGDGAGPGGRETPAGPAAGRGAVRGPLLPEAGFRYIGTPRPCWPARPGEPQWGWEPPRTVADPAGVQLRGLPPAGADPAGHQGAGALPGQPAVLGHAPRELHDRGREPGAAGRREPPDAGEGEAEPPVGGDDDGAAYRLDYALLCESSDSRIDELRLLGNGVVPATAERAFRVLAAELAGRDVSDPKVLREILSIGMDDIPEGSY